MNTRPLHVLVLSRNYPNRAFPHLGLWVSRQTAALAKSSRLTVLTPTPYCPPGPLPEAFRKFRGIEAVRMDGSVEVHHPRFLTGPGNTTYAFDALSQYASLQGRVAAIHRVAPVDLIHAHFTYPEGAAATMLGRRFGLPVVITEHNLLRPWIDQLPAVRRQALRALSKAAAIVAVSRAVRLNMEAVARRSVPAHVLPIGVDPEAFPLKTRVAGDSDNLLYVGWLNEIKGVDVLLRAMALLLQRRPHARLTLIGGSAYPQAQLRESSMHALAQELGIAQQVDFRGPKPAEEVARAMREADVFVLASRRESCGSVLLEALASGTPVVATRSGGPEDIVSEALGKIVPVDDPPALAAAIAQVLEQRSRYDPGCLRAHAVDNFSWDGLAARYLEIYREAVATAGVSRAGRDTDRGLTGPGVTR